MSDPEPVQLGEASQQIALVRDTPPLRLHFQRSYVFDEQDIALGMNDVYVERNDQSQSAYGGISRVELHSVGVTVALSGRTADRLGDNHFEIGLSITPAELEELAEGLREVFSGTEILHCT